MQRPNHTTASLASPVSRRKALVGGAMGAGLLLGSGIHVGAASAAAGPADLPQLWIGAANRGGLAEFRDIDSLIGPLHIRRCFSPGLPESFDRTEAAGNPAAGYLTFLSTKAPPAEVAAGLWDTRIAAFARSWPAGHYPAWWTMWHEPENDMTGAQFVAMFRRFFAVAKQANPRLRIGYVAMTYQWRPGSPTTIRPDDWWPGADAVDFLGCDDYNVAYPDRQPGRWHTLADDPEFQRWYGWARTKHKWLHVIEYGCKPDPADPGHRGRTLLANEQYLRQQGTFRMFLYWQATGDLGDWRLDDPASIDAWRAIASRGSTPR